MKYTCKGSTTKLNWKDVWQKQPETTIKVLSDVLGINLSRCSTKTSVSHFYALKSTIVSRKGVITTQNQVKAGNKLHRSNDSVNVANYEFEQLAEIAKHAKHQTAILFGSVETHQCEPHVECRSCKGSGICPECNGEKTVTCPVCYGNKECISCNGTGRYTCENCGGSGECPECDDDCCVECDNCGGWGEVDCWDCNGTGRFYNNRLQREVTCRSCHGTGKHTCSDCHGSGRVTCDECGGDGDCTHCHGEGSFECKACHGTGACGKCKGRGEIMCHDCNGTGVCYECKGSGCSRCRGTGKYQTYMSYGVSNKETQTFNLFCLDSDSNEYESLDNDVFGSIDGDIVFDDKFLSYLNEYEKESKINPVCIAISKSRCGFFRKWVESLKLSPQKQSSLNTYVFVDAHLKCELIPVTKFVFTTPSKQCVILVVGKTNIILYDQLPSIMDRTKGFFKNLFK